MDYVDEPTLTPPGDRNTLVLDLWSAWGARINTLDDPSWTAPTRLPGWNVAALCAARLPGPGRVRFAPGCGGRRSGSGWHGRPGAALLQRARRYCSYRRAAGGPHGPRRRGVRDTSVDRRSSIVERFTETGPAALRRLGDFDPGTAISHPVLGTVAFGALRDVALVEATVHLLDLTGAIGGLPPATEALAATSSILIDAYGVTAFIEAATGRAQDKLVAVMR